MKALEYLKQEQEIKKLRASITWGYYSKSIDEAIKELEDLQKEKDFLEKYYWFSKKKEKNHLKTNQAGLHDLSNPKEIVCIKEKTFRN